MSAAPELEQGWICPRCATIWAPDVTHCMPCLQHYRKRCDHCKISFYPRVRTQRYCTRSCNNSAQSLKRRFAYEKLARGVIERVCVLPECGRTYKVWHRLQKYCTNRCMYTHRNRRIAEKRKAKRDDSVSSR